VHPAAEAFRGVAELYERARPSYPDEAVALLRERLGLGPGRTVLDIAAGTGKLTRLLVPSGARVIAVEPLAEMRELLLATGLPIEAVDGTAETLPLPDSSVDAVTVGQAFHWFDAEHALGEIHRVLRPGGGVALIWNVRDPCDDLQAALDELLRPYRSKTPSHRDDRWRAVVEASTGFGDVDEWSFGWEQLYTRDELVDRIASISFVAQLDESRRSTLLAQVRAAAENLPEPFAFRHRTDVFVFPRSG
jgi:ubiquinone/menaquinone biosynthesis C-methylase UbiE